MTSVWPSQEMLVQKYLQWSAERPEEFSGVTAAAIKKVPVGQLRTAYFRGRYHKGRRWAWMRQYLL